MTASDAGDEVPNSTMEAVGRTVYDELPYKSMPID